eukprot:CAMPEP_0184328332 /NCGR_PEP_ID=MMETSP1049-20130417/143566_1 /TAXON_ID=77928 /ORGANISM="Proteomonas sulcata, Strain CCMP704" /LENGTH=54 /DNA_ID=CAMNT_0026650637 /DNA_START=1474 /DNA_END=1638 /DNA_ORIENTATION=+
MDRETSTIDGLDAAVHAVWAKRDVANFDGPQLEPWALGSNDQLDLGALFHRSRE